MGAAAFTQTSFQGGEWSPLMQGRIDLPKYRTAMNVCLNAIPLEEGACERRSGTKLLGNTRNGYTGKLIGWAPLQALPYIMEFTDSTLRFFFAGNLVTDINPPTVTGISSASPGVVTVDADQTWLTGDTVVFNFPDTVAPGVTTAPFQNRQMIVIMQSASTFTLKDAVTREDISGVGVSFADPAPTISHALYQATPFTSAILPNLRWIPFTSTTNVPQGVILSGTIEPQFLTTATPGPGTTEFTLSAVNFTDGPYLDPISGGSITVTVGSSAPVFGPVSNNYWVPQSGTLGQYNTGDMVAYAGQVWISKTGDASGTNVNNVPTDPSNEAWVLFNPIVPSDVPPYFPAWDSGASYVTWNGIGLGSCVSFENTVFAAVNRGTTNFNGATPPDPSNSGITATWLPVDIEQLNANIYNVVSMQMSFQQWSSLTAYAIGSAVTLGVNSYVSTVNANLNNEPDTSPNEWQTVNAGLAFGTNGAQQSDVGRLIRLFYQPAPWNANLTYAAGTNVTYIPSGIGSAPQYYTSVVSNSNADPTTNINDWLPATSAAFWVSGIVVGVTDGNTIQVQILSGSLPDNTPISIYQVGAFTNSNNNWPTCGCFYQGRLYLAGALPNRVDSSMSDNPVVFTPTGADGTVADNNAISFTLNSDDDETILWMKGTQQGILIGTRTREWMLSSSTTNDPITPATAEINPITHYGSAFVEPKTTGLATVFIQKFQRQLMEMVANVFSGKFNAPNLALTARHITAPGIAEVAYQEELAPVIWSRMSDGSLAGCTYRRLSAIQTDNPVLLAEPSTFAAWHRHALGSDRNVTSITMTYTPDATLDQLAMMTQDKVPTSFDVPTTPQLWVRQNGGPWNNTVSASPDALVGGIDLSSLTGGVLYPSMGGDTGGPSPFIEVTYLGGWNPDDKATDAVLSNGNTTSRIGSEDSGWARSAVALPNTPGVITKFELFLGPGEDSQDIWVGLSPAGQDINFDGTSTTSWANVVMFTNRGGGEIIVNGTTALSDFTWNDNCTLEFAYYYPLADNTLKTSYVEVMQPLADVDVTLSTSWFLDGAMPPSMEVTNGTTSLSFYGYTLLAGKTVSVWAGGLDCGDYTVGDDGSVEVPFGAANGLFTLDLVNSYPESFIPAIIGSTFMSQGQIVRPASQQETGSRIGPAQGQTRREHMFNALLFNTQGISFGTDFEHLFPAQLSDYESGPIYPLTQMYSGIHWDTVNDTTSFDGMLCWQITRPYPATVVNIGGWIRTAER